MSAISAPKFPPVKEQMDLLLYGAQEIISPEELERKITVSQRSGRPLIVKQGFDPSAPDLHLGHAVTIRKLRQFQQLGHRVIFLIGDFTGMVGDPSGKSKTRPRLTKEEVAVNAETYRQQVFKILDAKTTEIRFNSEWHAQRDVYQFLDLTSRYTVARMLERDDFINRYQQGEPISLLEFLYPLLQAYDSVALQADVEMGGQDQKFNLLLGRKIQGEYGLEAQVAFMMPLLLGTDGKEKMSKSLGNYVGICEPPGEIYGKIMSLPDSLIVDYLTLTTDLAASEIQKISSEISAGAVNPMIHKQRLARELVTLYHSAEEAQRAEENFIAQFRRKEIPDDLPEVAVVWAGATIPALKLLVESGAVASGGEGRRLIQANAVSVDGQAITEFHQELPLQDGMILKVGKRKLYRIFRRRDDV